MGTETVIPKFTNGEVLVGFCEWISEHANQTHLKPDRVIVNTFKTRLTDALNKRKDGVPDLRTNLKLAVVLRMLSATLAKLNNDFDGVEGAILDLLCLLILNEVEPDNTDIPND